MSDIVQVDQKQARKKWVDTFGYFEKYHSEIILKHFAPKPYPQWSITYDRNLLRGIFPFMLSISQPVIELLIIAYLSMRLL